ncbi:MAG: sugar phosphate isomerase/epimerase family protein [Flavobacteriaceae bacterium]|jgi:sugar phosphate isomerase/epimerase
MKAYTQTLAAIVLLVLGLFSCQSETKQKNEITLGIQTYSFRTMEDQSPLAILDYVKQTGIKNIELMGNHAEPFAGAPESMMSDRAKMAILIKQYRNEPLTDEEKVIAAEVEAQREAYNAEVQAWRKNVDLKKFEALKALYDEAGISIYAFKPRVFGKNNTDDDIRYGMRAAKALGASHVTLEHPEDDAHTARLAKIAEEEGVLIGYHGHEQQTPTLWDTALSQSDANRMNLDFGHYIAAENENPLEIIKTKSDKIVSMHLKDRQKKSNGGANLVWGSGDTPIVDVIKLIKENGYTFPVTIELEYDIPEGSDAVQEVKKCLAYIEQIQ